MKASLSSRFFTYLMLILTLIISLFPFYWMFILSTHTTAATNKFPPVTLPSDQLIENVTRVFSTINFSGALLNSLIVAGTLTISTLFFCSLASFALARLNFRGKKFLFVFIVSTMMFPVQLGIVPLYIIMTEFGWVNDLKAVIVPGLVSAFGVYWLKQFMEQTIHPELIESGRIDGCGNFQIYYRIALPMIGPGLATLGILTFMTVWNDFVWPLVVLKDDAVITIQIAIRKLSSVYYRDNAMIMAGAFMATLPLLIVFLFGGRYFVEGATEGSLKG